MLRFNTQERGLEEGFAQPLYRIQLETTNKVCFKTVLEIIRLYLGRERADKERAEQMKQYAKQYSEPMRKPYDTPAPMPEPSGCGVIMTSKGVKQTK